MRDGFTRTFSDEDVRETVQSAIDIVGRLECPDDLRVSAFAAVLNMVGSLQVRTGRLAVPEMKFGGHKLQ